MAPTERTIADSGNIIRYYYAGKAIAIIECSITNRSHTIGNHHTGKSIAIIECIIVNSLRSVRNLKFRDTIHIDVHAVISAPEGYKWIKCKVSKQSKEYNAATYNSGQLNNLFLFISFDACSIFYLFNLFLVGSN